MVTSKIDNAKIIVIALGNAASKKTKANRTTIFHSNVALTRSDVYVTAIKCQCNGQKNGRYCANTNFSKPNGSISLFEEAQLDNTKLYSVQ